MRNGTKKQRNNLVYDTMSNEDGDVVPSHLRKHPVFTTFRYADGVEPFPVYYQDPSVRTCVAHFGTYEYGLLALTTFVPSYLGYSATSNSPLMRSMSKWWLIFGREVSQCSRLRGADIWLTFWLLLCLYIFILYDRTFSGFFSICRHI